ncbi:hypothetical protein ONZ45_g13562 [Pleurotus djamor]|nr:hypothetical protein ONZ45_g13562 [Pleurotus djamor]
MKFISSASVVLSLLLVSTAANPLEFDQRAQENSSSRKEMGIALGAASGAAYFLTNEPEGSFIVGADIGSNGKLTLRRAISTDGLGAHGLADLNAPDPLFSQGAVKVSSAANLLAAVNPGSNTISLFSINPNDPTDLRMIGKPTSSGGEFPVSLAFSPDGKRVCALNGGALNGVNCFQVDQKRGLVSITGTNRSLGLNQTTPETGPEGAVSHILFAETNDALIVSVKGTPPTPGGFTVFPFQSDGTLAQAPVQVASAEGGLLPFGMAFLPGKEVILATDAGVGFQIIDRAGQRKSTVTIDGQLATCWTAFSKSTGNFYLTDVQTATITEVNVDDNLQGSIVKQYPLGKGRGTVEDDIASIGGRDFLYVLAANVTSIDVLSLDAPGQAKPIQQLDLAGPSRRAGLTLNAANIQGMTTFVKK